MDSSVSAEDEIWFLRVCHHVSNALYVRIGTRSGSRCNHYVDDIATGLISTHTAFRKRRDVVTPALTQLPKHFVSFGAVINNNQKENHLQICTFIVA